MPKNTKGGKKAKSMKNSTTPLKAREVPYPEQEDDSHVASITKVFGDGRYLCQIVDKSGILPGDYQINLSSGVKRKYARGIIIVPGTYVLMAFREFQKDKGDIIFVYKDSELDYLVQNDYIILSKHNEINSVEFKDGECKDDGFDFSEV